MADNTVGHVADPGNKRPHTAVKSSHAGSVGGIYTQTAFDWAAPKLAAVHTALAKRATQLCKTIHHGQSALAHLQEHMAAEKVPSSLRVRLAPAAQAHLASVPQVKEHVAAAEKLLMEAALQAREQKVTGAIVELSAILTGDVFSRAAKDATCFDDQSPKLRAVLQQLITDAEASFKRVMRFSKDGSKQRSHKEKAAAACAPDRERRAMKMNETEMAEAISLLLEAELTRQLPRLLQEEEARQLRMQQQQAARSDKCNQLRGRSLAHARR